MIMHTDLVSSLTLIWVYFTLLFFKQESVKVVMAQDSLPRLRNWSANVSWLAIKIYVCRSETPALMIRFRKYSNCWWYVISGILVTDFCIYFRHGSSTTTNYSTTTLCTIISYEQWQKWTGRDTLASPGPATVWCLWPVFPWKGTICWTRADLPQSVWHAAWQTKPYCKF